VRSEVVIQVAGLDLLASGYSIESSLLSPADAFSVEVPNPGGKLAGKIAIYDECRVLVDDTVQMTGWIDDINDRPGVLELVGRDRFGQIVDCCAEPQTLAGLDLQQIAEKLAAPFVTEWRFDNEENRAKLQTARRKYRYLKGQADQYDAFVSGSSALSQLSFPRKLDDTRLKAAAANLAKIKAIVFPRIKVQPGEKIAEVIQRAAAKTELHVWQAADGAGVIARPNYAQAPQYSVWLYPPDHADKRRNNVKAFAHTRSGRELFGEYRIAGTAANTPTTSGEGSRHEVTRTSSWWTDETLRAKRATQKVASEPPEVGTCAASRKLIVARGSGQNRQQAQRELDRDIAERQFNAHVLTYTIEGHAQDGRLWQVDTLVSVDDQVTGHSGNWYVVRRRFEGSLGGGQQTELELRQPGLWLA